MRITWDEQKRLSNIRKHGLDFLDVTPEFLDQCILYPARQNRLLAVGTLRGRRVTVVIRLLGLEGVSVISMRSASDKERRLS